jgi:hypothetical protein
MAARSFVVRAFLAAIAVFLVFDRAPASQQAGSGRISGVIVAADTGVPVKRVTVALSGPARMMTGPTLSQPARDAARGRGVPGGVVGSVLGGLPNPSGSQPLSRVTDATGRFEFTDLEPGRYMVMVNPQSRFVRPDRPTPIDVTDGSASSVTIKLERTGAITGRLLDEGGEPLSRAQVSAIRKGIGNMRMMTMSASTDDLGQFRIFDLPPGDYYVGGRFNMQGGYDSGGPSEGYAPTYYPGVPSLEGAQLVKVRSGQDTSNVDFSLAQVPLGRITGTVRDASGQPVARTATGPSVNVSISSSRQDGLGDSRGASTRPDGTFVIGAIPPGEYYLSANVYTNTQGPSTGSGQGPNAIREGAFLPVTVSAGEQTVNVTLNRGATLSGHVVVEGTPRVPTGRGGVQSSAPRINLQVRPAPGINMSFNGPQPATAADDGSFELTGVRGIVMLSAFGGPLLKRIVHGADDLTTKPLVLTGNERVSDITVTMTWDTGRIEGTVTNDRGEPAGEAWVLLFPQDQSKWFDGSPYVYLTRSLSAAVPPLPPSAPPGMMRRAPGSFSGPPLLPGRYLAIAFDGTTNMMPPRDAATLQILAKSASAITVSVGETAAVQLRLSKPF